MKEKYNQLTLDVELLIINIVQGVALVSLADTSWEPITTMHVVYWPYIAVGLLFILSYWSLSLVHALSFISWPISIEHGFLYYLLGFFEIMTFKNITDPLHWFIFTAALFFLACIIYLFDYHLINQQKKRFQTSKEKKTLYAHILNRQRKELFIMPVGLLFSLFALFLLTNFRSQFIDQHWHLALVLVQLLFAILLLTDATKSFHTRLRLIGKSEKIKEE